MLTKKATLPLIIVSALLYAMVAVTERHFSGQLIILFAILFLIYGWVISSQHDEKPWLYAAIGFRIIFIFFLPLLSDDFYRFIWDGRLLAAGYHPFARLPSYYLNHDPAIPGITASLFQKLNSPEYFTVYPPVTQFIFWLSVNFSSDSIFGSVLVMRLFILAAEVGTLIFIRKILVHYGLPIRNSLVYALNPLVIIELTGNLHVEAIMIFFIVLSVWWMVKQRLTLASIALGFSIATKLVPLLMLPVLFFRLGWKRALQVYATVVVVVVILFLPLLQADLISGMTNGLGYYFQKFEFNASIYYLIREYGFWKYGYNIIQTAGWKLALTGAIGMGVYVVLEKFFKKEKLSLAETSVWSAILFVFTIYFFSATTVHPWYITSLVAFSVFIPWRYGVLWSALIFLTYIGYSLDGYHEHYGLIALEYVAVVSFLVNEIYRKVKARHHIT